MTATITRTELTVQQIEAIWHAADGTGLLCPDTEAVVVNWRDRFGYLAYNRYATVRSARNAAKRCAAKPEFRETYVVTRGRGDSLDIEDGELCIKGDDRELSESQVIGYADLHRDFREEASS